MKNFGKATACEAGTKPHAPDGRLATMNELSRWYTEGFQSGHRFARQEADYDELACIAREGDIPSNWDIFRAEILNTYGTDPSFEFQAFARGFASACREFFQRI